VWPPPPPPPPLELEPVLEPALEPVLELALELVSEEEVCCVILNSVLQQDNVDFANRNWGMRKWSPDLTSFIAVAQVARGVFGVAFTMSQEAIMQSNRG
jgi:hypothetical protein